MRTKKPRYESHNDPGLTHSETMVLRKATRALRIRSQANPVDAPIPGDPLGRTRRSPSTGALTSPSVTTWLLRPLKTSRYDPKTEAEKHGENHR